MADKTPYTPVFDFSPNGKTQQRAAPDAPVVETRPRQPDTPVAAPSPRPQTNALPGVAARTSFGKRGL